MTADFGKSVGRKVAGRKEADGTQEIHAYLFVGKTFRKMKNICHDNSI